MKMCFQDKDWQSAVFGIGTEGTGLAFMNRLLRSAGFRVEYL